MWARPSVGERGRRFEQWPAHAKMYMGEGASLLSASAQGRLKVAPLPPCSFLTVPARSTEIAIWSAPTEPTSGRSATATLFFEAAGSARVLAAACGLEVRVAAVAPAQDRTAGFASSRTPSSLAVVAHLKVKLTAAASPCCSPAVSSTCGLNFICQAQLGGVSASFLLPVLRDRRCFDGHRQTATALAFTRLFWGAVFALPDLPGLQCAAVAAAPIQRNEKPSCSCHGHLEFITQGLLLEMESCRLRRRVQVGPLLLPVEVGALGGTPGVHHGAGTSCRSRCCALKVRVGILATDCAASQAEGVGQATPALEQGLHHRLRGHAQAPVLRTFLGLIPLARGCQPLAVQRRRGSQREQSHDWHAVRPSVDGRGRRFEQRPAQARWLAAVAYRWRGGSLLSASATAGPNTAQLPPCSSPTASARCTVLPTGGGKPAVLQLVVRCSSELVVAADGFVAATSASPAQTGHSPCASWRLAFVRHVDRLAEKGCVSARRPLTPHLVAGFRGARRQVAVRMLVKNIATRSARQMPWLHTRFDGECASPAGAGCSSSWGLAAHAWLRPRVVPLFRPGAQHALRLGPTALMRVALGIADGNNTGRSAGAAGVTAPVYVRRSVDAPLSLTPVVGHAAAGLIDVVDLDSVPFAAGCGLAGLLRGDPLKVHRGVDPAINALPRKGAAVRIICGTRDSPLAALKAAVPTSAPRSDRRSRCSSCLTVHWYAGAPCSARIAIAARCPQGDACIGAANVNVVVSPFGCASMRRAAASSSSISDVVWRRAATSQRFWTRFVSPSFALRVCLPMTAAVRNGRASTTIQALHASACEMAEALGLDMARAAGQAWPGRVSSFTQTAAAYELRCWSVSISHGLPGEEASSRSLQLATPRLNKPMPVAGAVRHNSLRVGGVAVKVERNATCRLLFADLTQAARRCTLVPKRLALFPVASFAGVPEMCSPVFVAGAVQSFIALLPSSSELQGKSMSLPLSPGSGLAKRPLLTEGYAGRSTDRNAELWLVAAGAGFLRSAARRIGACDVSEHCGVDVACTPLPPAAGGSPQPVRWQRCCFVPESSRAYVAGAAMPCSRQAADMPVHHPLVAKPTL